MSFVAIVFLVNGPINVIESIDVSTCTLLILKREAAIVTIKKHIIATRKYKMYALLKLNVPILKAICPLFDSFNPRVINT
jgi:hypothetical protein